MLIYFGNYEQDIEIEMINDNDLKKTIFSCFLRSSIKGLPFKIGDILTITNKGNKHEIVGINGKEIEIDYDNSAADAILFYYK